MTCWPLDGDISALFDAATAAAAATAETADRFG